MSFEFVSSVRNQRGHGGQWGRGQGGGRSGREGSDPRKYVALCKLVIVRVFMRAP